MNQTERLATSKPLRVAVVGAGRMGREHAKGISKLPQLATVVAAVDPDEGARRDFEELVPGARTFASLEALLSDEGLRPGVVHVCTAPAHTHAAIARKALQAGAHIYVEKPFVDDSAAADEILGEAEAQGLKVCCGYQLLGQDVARQAADFLESPGSTVHVESYFAFKPRRTGASVRLRISEEEQLFDILPHPTYVLLHLLSRAEPGQSTEIESVGVGSTGSVHVLLRRGSARGLLCVSLQARPVESFVRIERSNGRMEVDFMRGTVQRLQGAGTSALQKILDPFRWAWQLMVGTTVALAKRFLGKGGGYLGLETLIGGFYRSILDGTESPISPELISDTEKVADAVRGAVRRLGQAGVGHTGVQHPGQADVRDRDTVVVTGGAGFLGRRLVRELLDRGYAVRVLSRGEPSPWDRLAGVEYVTCDLGESVPRELFRGADCVIHAAAATAGGYETHERDSVDATRHVVEAAAEAGVPKVVYVSSLAVIDAKGRRQLDEQSPLLTGREAGPYAWGKATAEAEGARVAGERGVPFRVVRPGPIVDFERFDPPGRLGRWVGSWFVAVGPPRDMLYVVDVGFMARTLVWVAEHFEDAPPVLHGLSPTPPTRRELADRLRAANPGARVAWLPRILLVVLSGIATVLQKVLRPKRPAVSIANAFASTRYDTTLIESLEGTISEESRRDVPTSKAASPV